MIPTKTLPCDHPLPAVPELKRTRRRFQFSLRTLVLVVLIAGMTWVMTICIGGAQLVEQNAKKYQSDKMTISSTGFSSTASIAYKFDATISGQVFSPAPLILVFDLKWNAAHDRDIYIWLFGKYVVVQEHKSHGLLTGTRF